MRQLRETVRLRCRALRIDRGGVPTGVTGPPPDQPVSTPSVDPGFAAPEIPLKDQCLVMLQAEDHDGTIAIRKNFLYKNAVPEGTS